MNWLNWIVGASAIVFAMLFALAVLGPLLVRRPRVDPYAIEFGDVPVVPSRRRASPDGGAPRVFPRREAAAFHSQPKVMP